MSEDWLWTVPFSTAVSAGAGKGHNGSGRTCCICCFCRWYTIVRVYNLAVLLPAFSLCLCHLHHSFLLLLSGGHRVAAVSS